MSRMETYPATISLGEESAQMWSLNKRLEAYLSRVKALEEENELLRAEIHHLKSTRSDRSSVRKYHDEIMKLRDALDDGHREIAQVQIDRDSIYQEIEYVKELCHHEKQAQEDVKKELSESKKLLEEEKRAQIWLKERLIQLEHEIDDILKTHEEDKALMEEEISNYSQRLENFKIAPTNFKPVNVEDYASKLSQIWQGAVEEYKNEVSALEANLSQAKDNLKKVLDENKQSQQQLQSLDRDLQSLKVRKEMLEKLLGDQWLEQQEEEGRLQLEIETLEKEKQDLRVQIAQVLEDRQQLMHLKMSLSLEVATYRSLLEAESTRLYTSSADYKMSSSFHDSMLEQNTFRKSRHENIKPLVPNDNRLKANKKQSAETSSNNRYLNVKSTSFPSRASPVTKEFQKVSSVLHSQGLNYTKASSAKAATTLPSVDSNVERRPRNGEAFKKSKVQVISHSYSQDSSKPVTKETVRKDKDLQPVVNGNVYDTIDTGLKKADHLLPPIEKETVSTQVETTKHVKVLSDFGLEQQHSLEAQKKDNETLVFEEPHKDEIDFEVPLANDDHSSDGLGNIDDFIEKQEVRQIVSSQRVSVQREELVEPLEYQNMETSIKAHKEEFRKVLDFSKPNTQDIDEPKVLRSDGGPEQGNEYSLSQELDFDMPVSSSNANVDNASHEAEEEKESLQLKESSKLNHTEETLKYIEAEVEDEEEIIDQTFQVLSSLKKDSDQLFDDGQNFTWDIHDEQKSEKVVEHKNTDGTKEVPQDINIQEYNDKELDQQPPRQDEDVLDEVLSLDTKSEVNQMDDGKLEYTQFDEGKQDGFDLSNAESKDSLSNEVDFRTEIRKEEEGYERDYGYEEKIINKEQNIHETADIEQSRVLVVKEVYQSNNKVLEDFEETQIQHQEEKIKIELSDVDKSIQSYDDQQRTETIKQSEEITQEFSDTNQEESEDQKNKDFLDQLNNGKKEVTDLSEEIVDSPQSGLDNLKSGEQSDTEQEGQEIVEDHVEKKQIVPTMDNKEGDNLLDSHQEQEELHDRVLEESVTSNKEVEDVQKFQKDIEISVVGPQIVQSTPEHMRQSSESEEPERDGQSLEYHLTQEEGDIKTSEVELNSSELKAGEEDLYVGEENHEVCTVVEYTKLPKTEVITKFVHEEWEAYEDNVTEKEGPAPAGEGDYSGKLELEVQKESEEGTEHYQIVSIEDANKGYKENEGNEQFFQAEPDVQMNIAKESKFFLQETEPTVEGQSDILTNMEEDNFKLDYVVQDLEADEYQPSIRETNVSEDVAQSDGEKNHEESSKVPLTTESKEGETKPTMEKDQDKDQAIATQVLKDENIVKLDEAAEKDPEETRSFHQEVEGQEEDNQEGYYEGREDQRGYDSSTLYANVVSEEDDKINQSLQKEFDEEPHVGFSLNIIPNNLRFTTEDDAEAEQQKTSKFSEEGTEFQDDDIHVYEELKHCEQNNEDIILEEKEREEEFFEKEIICQQATVMLGHERENVVLGNSKSHVLFADHPNKNYELDGCSEKNLTELDEVEVASNPDNEHSKSDYSMDSQDISIFSHKSEEFEISKDYQLEQTLPDTTPLPNLDDEFEDLVEDELLSEQSTEVTKSQSPIEGGEAEEVLDSSVESQSSQILPEVSEQSNLIKDYNEQLDESPKDVQNGELDRLVTEEPVAEDSSTTMDTEEVTKSQSLVDGGEAEEVLDSSLESQSSQILPEISESSNVIKEDDEASDSSEQYDESPIDLVESEHPEHFLDLKLDTEDFSAKVDTEELAAEPSEDLVRREIDDENTESAVTESSLADGCEVEKVLYSSLESQTSQVFPEVSEQSSLIEHDDKETDYNERQDESPIDFLEIEHPQQSVETKLNTEDSSATVDTEEPDVEPSEDLVKSKVDSENTERAVTQSFADSGEAENVLDSSLEQQLSEEFSEVSEQLALIKDCYEQQDESPIHLVEKEHPEHTEEPASEPSEDPVENKIDEDVLDSSLESQSSQVLLEGSDQPSVNKDTDYNEQEDESPIVLLESEHPEHFIDPKLDIEDFTATVDIEEPASEPSEDLVESKIDDIKTEEVLESSSETQSPQIIPEVNEKLYVIKDSDYEEEQDESPKELYESEPQEHTVDPKLDTKMDTEEPVAEPSEDLVKCKIDNKNTELEYFVDPKLDTEEDNEEGTKLQSHEEAEVLDSRMESQLSGVSDQWNVIEDSDYNRQQATSPIDLVTYEHPEYFLDPKLVTEDSSLMLDTEEVTEPQSPGDGGEAEELLDSSLSQEVIEESSVIKDHNEQHDESPTDSLDRELEKQVVVLTLDIDNFSTTLVTEGPATELSEDSVVSKIDESECFAEPNLDTKESSAIVNTEEVTKSQSLVEAEVLESSLEQSSQVLLVEGEQSSVITDYNEEQDESPINQVHSDHPEHFVHSKPDTEDSSATLDTEVVTESESPADGCEAEEMLDSSLESQLSQIFPEVSEPGNLIKHDEVSDYNEQLDESAIVFCESDHPEHFVETKLDTEDFSTTLNTEVVTESESPLDDEAEEEFDGSVESSQILSEVSEETNLIKELDYKEQQDDIDLVESEQTGHVVDPKLDSEESSSTPNTEEMSKSQSPADDDEAEEVLDSSMESQSSQVLSEVHEKPNFVEDSDYNAQQESPIDWVESEQAEHVVDPKLDIEVLPATLNTENVIETESSADGVEAEEVIDSSMESQSSQVLSEVHEQLNIIKDLDYNEQQDESPVDQFESEHPEHFIDPKLDTKDSTVVTEDLADKSFEEPVESKTDDGNSEKNEEFNVDPTDDGTKEPSTEFLDEFNGGNITLTAPYILNEEDKITLGTDQDDYRVYEKPSEESSENDGSESSNESSPNVSIINYALEQEDSMAQCSDIVRIGGDIDSKSPNEFKQNEPLLTPEPVLEGSLTEQVELQTSSEDGKAIVGERSDSLCDSNKEHDDMAEYTRHYDEDGKTVNGIYGHTIVQATLDLDGHMYNGHSTEEKSEIIISEAKTFVKLDDDIIKSQSQERIEDSVIEFTVSEGKSEGLFQSLLQTSEHKEGHSDDVSDITATYKDSDAEQSHYTKKLINPYLSERDLEDAPEVTSLGLDEDLVDTHREVKETNQGLKINQKQEDSWSSDE
ncbi:nestin [Dendropsophus ebraccatus]|uniref:nestin n=1 Tax=Dendropsophus ebraccatus TaxID=150705 RepID=UPI003831C62E